MKNIILAVVEDHKKIFLNKMDRTSHMHHMHFGTKTSKLGEKDSRHVEPLSANNTKENNSLYL